MKRVNVFYGGLPYSIGHRSVEDVQAEIETGLDAGGRTWLTVNYGEGLAQQTKLLITPGVDIALVGIDDPDAEGDDEAVSPPAV
ncbi:hypothetical protein N1027_11325 [Herbiconiux sp. CPCC 205763]|uniref:Uncharacterized protein n=1 Tax=Herbiconiux aconitum TaxID=2970913 RepID=A0ABT2GR77_9MICO|nr:hypothetical protein [Herbiconiux aconitum]MCS5718723.1 hypothetical protein [Herbiconiux aconitum]